MLRLQSKNAKEKFMKAIKLLVCFSACVAMAMPGAAQVTHGQPPVLPPPYTKPVVANPSITKTTPGFVPKAPRGFKVTLFAQGEFKEPRYLALAPNGDIFLADTTLNKVFVLHDPGRGAASDSRTVFAEGLKEPFGIAFHDDYVYIGDTNEVVRFRFDPKTSKRLGEREHILDLPSGGMHSTRTVVFSPDGKKMYVSIGSDSNASPNKDSRRAAILVANPDGSDWSIFASGLRNAVGLAINPDTGQLWADVNERDMLGDNLPPDYFTSVKPGGFYGWPYSYIGKNLDDRPKPQRPDLVAKAIIPDVLLGPHIAPLEGTFYTASQFPAEYRHGAFIAEHGSWNRSILNGYNVTFVPFKDGQPSGSPSPFLTGFVPDPHSRIVEGRPVGVVVSKDGALLVSDDGGNVVWKVYEAE
jgi:glucose/arabinose dehydrogenase